MKPLRALTLCAALLLLNVPTFAQTQPPQQPILSMVGPITWTPAESQRIGWTLTAPDEFTRAESYGVLAYIDEQAPMMLQWPSENIFATCYPITVNAVARFCTGMTDMVRVVLNVPGVHHIQLTITDLTTMVEGVKSDLITVVTKPLTCPFGPRGSVTPTTQMPVGTAIQGVLAWNITAGDNGAAVRIAQLRAWGWHVEWAPLGTPSLPSVVVLASCPG